MQILNIIVPLVVLFVVPKSKRDKGTFLYKEPAPACVGINLSLKSFPKDLKGDSHNLGYCLRLGLKDI